MTSRIRDAVLVSALLVLLPTIALADAHTISVTGEGHLNAVPDGVTLSVGLETTNRTAQGALTENARVMSVVFATLKAIGIPERAVQTSNFSVSPQFSSDRSDVQKIVGYQTTNQVDVTLDDQRKLGPSIDALVAAGANRINSVTFFVQDSETLMDKARILAMADARRRAETLSHAGGVSLGPVISIAEVSSSFASPVRFDMVRAAAPAVTPTAAGEQTISVSVNVVYELK